MENGAATIGITGATCCRIICRRCDRYRINDMKKIGILFGQEHSFPPAFVERVNQKTGGKLRSEEHTSELQSRENLVCRLLLEKKKDFTTAARGVLIDASAG